MKQYWKAKLIQDLLNIQEGIKDNSTITMEYVGYQKEMLRLVSQAYEDGWNDSIKSSLNTGKVKG